MAENASPSIELLDGNDEHVKCVLGLMAYRKLIQLKDAYEQGEENSSDNREFTILTILYYSNSIFDTAILFYLV